MKLELPIERGRERGRQSPADKWVLRHCHRNGLPGRERHDVADQPYHGKVVPQTVMFDHS